MADKGTIFLDEIGDISLTVQSHLLRVLQEGEIRRIGSKRIIPVNVRVITATNKNLHDKMRDGSFRTDLFYRLNVLNLYIPSLKREKSGYSTFDKASHHKKREVGKSRGRRTGVFSCNMNGPATYGNLKVQSITC